MAPMMDNAATAETDPDPVASAASLIIFRRDSAGGPAQLLMVERSNRMRFAGGAAVFPGGRVDPADFRLAETLGLPLETVEIASRIAAVRETLEETGLLVGISETVDAQAAASARRQVFELGSLAAVLDRNGWTLDFDQLVPFARWLPKHHKSRAFDTRFYLTDLGSGRVDLEVDATENRKLFWSSAEHALELANDGKIAIIFPTRRNLERLAQFDTFEKSKAHVESIPIRAITPEITIRNGARWMSIADDHGYPVTSEELSDEASGEGMASAKEHTPLVR